MAAVNPDGYAQAVRALGAGLLRTDAARVTAPSLVAVGAQDVVTPPPNAEAVAHALRRCRPLVLVPDAGHALPQEAPALVAGLLETLIQDVSHG
jgi:pimeloyl-ACP methyl ester carboxylesterase